MPESKVAQRFHYTHGNAPVCALGQGPLAGLCHRTVIDARTGAAALALWQEEHLPGFLVPPHRHDCEEIITVLDGSIRGFIEGVDYLVGPGESILIPAWSLHGFEVTSDCPVRLVAIFSSNAPHIFRADGTESTPPWEGGASDHLETNA